MLLTEKSGACVFCFGEGGQLKFWLVYVSFSGLWGNLFPDAFEAKAVVNGVMVRYALRAS